MKVYSKLLRVGLTNISVAGAWDLTWGGNVGDELGSLFGVTAFVGTASFLAAASSGFVESLVDFDVSSNCESSGSDLGAASLFVSSFALVVASDVVGHVEFIRNFSVSNSLNGCGTTVVACCNSCAELFKGQVADTVQVSAARLAATTAR